MAGVAISRRIRPTAALTGVCCDQLITCEQLIGPAAEELAAFLAIVKQEFGLEQASQAAGDWLQELACSDCFGQASIPDFRQLTVAAANRLARRIGRRDPSRAESGDPNERSSFDSAWEENLRQVDESGR